MSASWPSAAHAQLGPFRVAYRDVLPTTGSPVDAPPLVLVHGLGSSSLCWLRNLPALSASRRLVLVDLPGCGESDKPRYRYSLGFWRARLLRLLDHLEIDRAVFVGHSMGAQLAMLTALDYADRVHALVLAAPAGLERFTPTEATMLQRSVSASSIRRQSQLDLRGHLGLAFHRWPDEAERLLELRRRMRGPELDGYAHAFAAGVRAMLDAPVHDRLGEIAAPTLLVLGREDRLVPNRWLHPSLTPADLARGAKRALPDAELVLVPEAGHLVQFERPDVFDAAVLDFLERRALAPDEAAPRASA